ncbi:translation initiation factor IF-2-like [Felis catus]|uniref:translation initiation factor IF-2-like n=1 Tax=Felis catus TaxID=9685 RepID=UPI001D19F72A|nr:translation initiation factor IF-2-like [Felis catus]
MILSHRNSCCRILQPEENRKYINRSLQKSQDHATYFMHLDPSKSNWGELSQRREGGGPPAPEGREGLIGTDAPISSEEKPPFDLCSVHPRIPTYTDACLLQGRLAPSPPHPMLEPTLEGTRESSSRPRGWCAGDEGKLPSRPRWDSQVSFQDHSHPYTCPWAGRTPGGGWQGQNAPYLGGGRFRRRVGFPHLLFGFGKPDPNPQNSQRRCGGLPGSPPVAPRPLLRGTPGNEVLGLVAATGGPQAQTTGPRMHCTPQPEEGRGCPWQQSGSPGAGTRTRTGVGGRGGGGGAGARPERGKDAGRATDGRQEETDRAAQGFPEPERGRDVEGGGDPQRRRERFIAREGEKGGGRLGGGEKERDK